jgi:hypothetical protein
MGGPFNICGVGSSQGHWYRPGAAASFATTISTKPLSTRMLELSQKTTNTRVNKFYRDANNSRSAHSEEHAARIEAVRRAAMRTAERAAARPLPTKLPKAVVDSITAQRKKKEYEKWRADLERRAAAEERVIMKREAKQRRAKAAELLYSDGEAEPRRERLDNTIEISDGALLADEHELEAKAEGPGDPSLW